MKQKTVVLRATPVMLESKPLTGWAIEITLEKAQGILNAYNTPVMDDEDSGRIDGIYIAMKWMMGPDWVATLERFVNDHREV